MTVCFYFAGSKEEYLVTQTITLGGDLKRSGEFFGEEYMAPRQSEGSWWIVFFIGGRDHVEAS